MIGLTPSFFRERGDANTDSLSLVAATSQSARYAGPAADYNIAGNALTMEQWVKHTTTAAVQVYQGQFDFVANQEAYACYYQNSATALRFRLENPAGLQDYVQWAIVPPIGVWRHYAFVWDGSLTVAAGSMKLYVNGVDAGAPATLTVNNIVALKASTAAYVVGAWDGGSAPGSYFNGLIDEVRLWTVARTGPEILANYNKQIDPATPGLFHYFRWNGGVYTDLAAGNNLTGVNAPTFSNDVPFP